MEVRVGSVEASGRAVDLSTAVERGEVPTDRATLAEALASAVEAGADPACVGVPVAVSAPDAGPGHAALGLVPDGRTARQRLAAAARSRGKTASVEAELTARRAELASLPEPAVDLREARERAADARGEEERLRERVASLRGEVNARRDLDAATGDAEAALREAATALSEAETARIAADQALERARRRAREARDTRERRLELADAVGNLARAARRELADAVRPAVDEALAAVPGPDGSVPPTGHRDRDLSAMDLPTVSLAAIRVADLDAPVVLALERRRFADAAAAARTLDAPVIRL
ncbi:hypothetical protein GCM10027435_10840 [Haloparvum alkalitolerans]|uniref:DUF7856 family protein n=1 Tax=Haloparvum alkalitolerans TaxID=1042953 RepID=UPI003CF98455